MTTDGPASSVRHTDPKTRFLAAALISFLNTGSVASMGYCCTNGVPSMAACINASVSLTETLAPVTFPSVIFASMKASESGCLIDTLSINAPRRPS